MSTIRLARFVVSVTTVAAFAGVNAQEADRLSKWLAAVEAHEPGNPGKPTFEISTWPGTERQAVVTDAKRQARAIAKSDPKKANHILLGGAALFADLAKLLPEDSTRTAPWQESIYIVSDGRHIGSRYPTINWALGRQLLDSVVPTPIGHPDVRAWYAAATDDLFRNHSLAEAMPHLARARQLFPNDPYFLYASALLYERLASPSLQAAARSIEAFNRKADVGSEHVELQRAERFFRDVLRVDAANQGARVRFARIAGVFGRNKEASAELSTALRADLPPKLRYFAKLFMGVQAEALGNRTAARESYEDALRLFPRAQSPRIGLSELARRAGDRSEAYRQVQQIAQLPDNQRQREDPWWDYYSELP